MLKKFVFIGGPSTAQGSVGSSVRVGGGMPVMVGNGLKISNFECIFVVDFLIMFSKLPIFVRVFIVISLFAFV